MGTNYSTCAKDPDGDRGRALGRGMAVAARHSGLWQAGWGCTSAGALPGMPSASVLAPSRHVVPGCTSLDVCARLLNQV